MDDTRNGKVCLREIRSGLERLGVSMPPAILLHLFDQIDNDPNGQITFFECVTEPNTARRSQCGRCTVRRQISLPRVCCCCRFVTWFHSGHMPSSKRESHDGADDEARDTPTPPPRRQQQRQQRTPSPHRAPPSNNIPAVERQMIRWRCDYGSRYAPEPPPSPRPSARALDSSLGYVPSPPPYRRDPKPHAHRDAPPPTRPLPSWATFHAVHNANGAALPHRERSPPPPQSCWPTTTTTSTARSPPPSPPVIVSAVPTEPLSPRARAGSAPSPRRVVAYFAAPAEGTDEPELHYSRRASPTLLEQKAFF